MHQRRKKRFDIGLYQKLSKRMKEGRVHALAKEKVEKENQVKELKKTTEKLTNQIAYRKRKVLKSVSTIDKKNVMLLDTER